MKTPRQQIQNFYKPERDGITQSLLAKFLTCRQAALWYLKGYNLKSPSMSLTYGTIIHAVLERVYEQIRLGKLKALPSRKLTLKYIQKIEKEWIIENPRADKKSLEFLELSLLIAESTMPLYFDYWHKDIKGIKWEKVEGDFKLPITLKDKRKTFIRGKMDGVFKNPNRWLFETKTKMRVEEGTLVDYLPFELQVNTYLRALRLLGGKVPKGVLYNIVRRTAMRQGKKESMSQFAKRISEDIESRPDHYFIRLEVAIDKADMDNFEIEFISLIEDFYNWFDGKIGHYKNTNQCEGKYGACEYLRAESGIMVPYEKRKMVFKELEEK